MAKKPSSYWIQRALEREASYQSGSAATVATMQKIYERAFDNIQQQINSAKRQIAKNGLTDAEHYHERIAMLETLQERVYAECKNLENIERTVTAKRYSDVMQEGYYKSMFDIQKGVGYGFDFAKLPKSAIEQTMLDGWKGRNFSKSIWKNTETIASMSQEIIKAGFMSGASIQTMANQLDDVMNAGKFAAERLIRSETSYFANQGELHSYKEAGIEQYQYLATLDAVTSRICLALDSKIFSVSGAAVGLNYPPMHAFCRSTTVAWFDDHVLANIQRRARDPATGKTYLVPADMDYRQWLDKYYVKGSWLSGGNIGDKDKTSVINNITPFDFSDTEKIKQELDRFAKAYADAKVEHAMIISPNGKKYELTGNEWTVNIDLAGYDVLHGAIVTHNHCGAYADSFSRFDFESYFKCGMKELHVTIGGKDNIMFYNGEFISYHEAVKLYKDALSQVQEQARKTQSPIEFEQLETMRILQKTLRGLTFGE